VKYVELGRSGEKVSAIVLGTWQFGSRAWGYGRGYSTHDCVEAVKASVEAGVNLIDTAEIYGGGLSEKIVGMALKELGDGVMVASKVAPHHLTYGGVIKACERSLNRLGIRTIDLYQIHWPNPVIPIKDTMKAMEHLVKRGKIRYIGVSNFSLKLLRKARECLKNEEVVSNQVKYNLLERRIEKELLPYCQREGVTILAYSPLAQGILTGKYTPQNLPKDIVRRVNRMFTSSYLLKAMPLLDELKRTAEKYGVNQAQTALAWIISHDRCAAIAGAKNREQAVTNASAGELKLSDEEVRRLAELSENIKPGAGEVLRAFIRLIRQ